MDLKNNNEKQPENDFPGCLVGMFNLICFFSLISLGLGAIINNNPLVALLLIIFALVFCPILGYKIRDKLQIDKFLFTGLKFLFWILSLTLICNMDKWITIELDATISLIFNILILICLCISIILIIKYRRDNNFLLEKYSKIKNIDDEVDKQTQTLQKNEELIKNLYLKKEELEKLTQSLSDEAEMWEIGLYKPQFNYDDSVQYKNALTQNYEKQKDLIKKQKAIICTADWTIEGSKAKGKQMIQRNIKLMLKAFNGECDSVIAKVKWNNVDKMKIRIQKTFDNINKLGEPIKIAIKHDFLNLKFEEMFLTYEYEEKKYQEREEQKRLQEQMREEQKAERERQEAIKKAEKEKADFEKALKLAHEQLAQATEEERAKYEAQIAELQESLKEAEERGQRALSQAQLTKSGHIYVISNIGSFGENIYKIGMTRRLEPMDRINELGDASVPFKFDVHAIIYTENAPELENKLHTIFREKAVNLVNLKKEFFNVSLEEIEQAVKENYGEIEFTKIAEAREYRESLAIARARIKQHV